MIMSAPAGWPRSLDTSACRGLAESWGALRQVGWLRKSAFKQSVAVVLGTTRSQRVARLIADDARRQGVRIPCPPSIELPDDGPVFHLLRLDLLLKPVMSITLCNELGSNR